MAKPDRRAAWSVCLLALLVGGCNFDPGLRSGGVACSAAGVCPAGLDCRRGLCCAPGDDRCGSGGAGGAGGAPPAAAAEVAPPPDVVEGTADAAGDVVNLPPPCEPTLVGACGAGRTCLSVCTGAPGAAQSQCDPSLGAKRPGESCARSAECANNGACLTITCSGVEVRFCHTRCKTDPDCGTQQCSSITCFDGLSAFGFCHPTCDPVGAGSGCPAGLQCLLGAGDRVDCNCPRPPTLGGDGAPCLNSGSCQVGHVCLPSGDTSLCRPICRFNGNTCAAGTRCAVVPLYRDFGACVPAADPAPECDPTIAGACPAGEGCAPGCRGASPTTMSPTLTCEPSDMVPIGEACGGPNACQPGSVCRSNCSAADSVRICRRYCKVDADCGGGTSRCFNGFGCRANGQVFFRQCTIACDPRGAATAGCPAGTGCLLLSREETDCACPVDPTSPAEGEACDPVKSPACRLGTTCVSEGARRICRAICRLDAPATCPAARTCRPLPDQRIYGACRP